MPIDASKVVWDTPDLSKVQWDDAPQERSLLGAVGTAVTSIPSSGINFAKGLYGMVRHPVDTLKGITNAVEGGVRKVAPANVNNWLTQLESMSPFESDKFAASPEGQKQTEEAANGIAGFYKNRYGSYAKFKEALAKDPVGVAADVSTVLAGGGAAVRAVGGATGSTGVLRAANALQRGAEVTNPLAVVPSVYKVGKFIAQGAPRVLARPVLNVAEAFTPGGLESIKARAYVSSLGGEDNVNKAVELLRQGYSPEQVALQLNSSGFAALQTTGKFANNDVLDVYNARNNALFQPHANALLGASEKLTEGVNQAGQQQAALVDTLRKLQADALSAQRQTQAGALRGVRQQRQTQLGTAEAEAEAARQAAATAAEQQRAGVTQQQQQLAGQVPETAPLGVGQKVTERRAEVMKGKQDTLVTPAYEAAFKLAPDEFEVPSTIETATNLRSSTEARLNPDLAPRTSETLRTFGNVDESRLNPLTGERYTVSVPRKVTLRDADKLVKDINADLARLSRSTDPAVGTAERNLRQLKSAVEADIEAGVSPEAATAYKNARTVARTEVIEPYKKGWLANLEREGATGAQIQAPEGVVTKILSGEDEARRFTRALGADQQSMQSVRAGILDQYRNEVMKDGVLNPRAHAAFMSNAKYGRALAALDDAGMGIRAELESFGTRARDLSSQSGKIKVGEADAMSAIEKDFRAKQNAARTAAQDAAEATRAAGQTERAGISQNFQSQLAQAERTYKPTVQEMKVAASKANQLLGKLAGERFNVQPDAAQARLVALTKNNPELQKAVADAERLIMEEVQFRNLASQGEKAGATVEGKVTQATGKPVAPWVKGMSIPVINFIMARLSGTLDATLAAEIGMELISSKLPDILEQAAGKAQRTGFKKIIFDKTTKPAQMKTPIVNALTGQRGLVGTQVNNALAGPQ